MKQCRSAALPVLAALLALTACSTPEASVRRGGSVATSATLPASTASQAPPTEASGMTWEILAGAPVERIEADSTAQNGVIWLAGGLNLDGSASEETWRDSDGWSRSRGRGPLSAAATATEESRRSA